MHLERVAAKKRIYKKKEGKNPSNSNPIGSPFKSIFDNHCYGPLPHARILNLVRAFATCVFVHQDFTQDDSSLDPQPAHPCLDRSSAQHFWGRSVQERYEASVIVWEWASKARFLDLSGLNQKARRRQFDISRNHVAYRVDTLPRRHLVSRADFARSYPLSL